MIPSYVALLIALLLVLANAFFVASEFAIVKIRVSRLEQLAAQGQRRAKVALAIAQRLDEYLSANQLGITLASLALGWIGEPAFAGILHGPLSRMGFSERTIGAASWGASFGIITFLHTVLGELAPKSLAIQRTEPVALWTAAPLRAFYVAAYPIIWTLNSSANLVLRVLGLRPASETESLHSPEELRLLLRRMPLDSEARRFIDRVFDYTHRVARHVMILRRDVVTLAARKSFEENLRVALANEYTRYPLVEEESDEVVGYVHFKDLVAAAAAGRRPSLRELARQPVFAREDAPLENIRQAFTRHRAHLAVVRDEHGAFTGIVTLEDLLEELVGEIQDEQDVGEVPPIVRAGEGRWDVDGRLTLDVAERELGLTITDAPPGTETLGGYVTARLGEIPRRSQLVQAGGFRITIVAVREQRVSRLRVERAPEKPPEGEAGEPDARG